MKYLFIVILLLSTTGCALLPNRKPKTPATTVTTPHATIKMDGDAAAPAEVKQSTTKTDVPLPAGVTLTFNEKLGTLSLTLPTVSHLTQTTERVEAKQATAFTPPAPPTALETKTAETVGWFYLAIAVGAAGFIFGLIRGWNLVMTGGAVVIGGALIGIFLASHPILSICLLAAGGTLAITGPTLWHLVVKPKLNENPTVQPSA